MCPSIIFTDYKIKMIEIQLLNLKLFPGKITSCESVGSPGLQVKNDNVLTSLTLFTQYCHLSCF